MQTTLGGDRLGSGNKQEISLRNYERSTHDLSYIWRSTMASGTLVPFMSKVGLPGDKLEIDLNCEILTVPTVGPLFGSYKVQLDVFEVPMRLYNAKLHMNKLGVGMDMAKILLPQVGIRTNNAAAYVKTYLDNEHINSSALFKYLGISGLGRTTGTSGIATRYFNAIPYLAYWDIYKNYYSNKQENIGFVIHTDSAIAAAAMTPKSAYLFSSTGASKGNILAPNVAATMATGDTLQVYFPANALEPVPGSMGVKVAGAAAVLDAVFSTFWWDATQRILHCSNLISGNATKTLQVLAGSATPVGNPTKSFGLKAFPLPNIDTMRENILQFSGAGAFMVNKDSLDPYGLPMVMWGTAPYEKTSVQFSQEGLGIKTYQSDLFNNWINTEWIDGTNGISALTAVDTSTGEFTIDALNIASKVYDMLNRIAVSGGSYDDWLEAVYTHERVKGVESPVYCGGLIKELSFEEVISLANTDINGESQPLGTLAGRGRLTGKHKGGKVEITVNEPSYIIGIVSLTPRVDYSQGNDWDVNLKTYDDFHKPALDAIGFQDLITGQLWWGEDLLNVDTYAVTHKSLGKQPAWINYMTSVNKNFGGFAEQDDSMFMVLNRRYEKNADGTLKDPTTYIDPTKYNHIFAQTSLDSQNFWCQIGVNLIARRKMSAKVIPNL